MRKFIKGFAFALNGIKVFFSTQLNGRFHVFAAVLVIILGFVFKITCYEWISILLAIGLVIITEMINTAIEFLCNFITTEIHSDIKKIKDISAGAVLISAIIAFCIGLIIFVPHILEII